MSDFIRLLSYVYEYVEDKKCENVGFVKLDGRNGTVRVYVNLRTDASYEQYVKVFLCKRNEGMICKTFLDEGKLAKGRLEMMREISVDELDGCFAVYISGADENDKKCEYCTFLSDNTEEISVIRGIIESDTEDSIEDNTEENIEIASAVEEELMEENKPHDMWSELYNQYPKCRIFGEEYQCIMLKENLILAFKNN